MPTASNRRIAKPPRTDPVVIVLPTLNSRRWLAGCLSVLTEASCEAFDLQVVDNGSIDGTPDVIADRWPEVHVVRLAQNVGYGAAVNIGASLWPTHHVLALNIDTIPSPAAIEALRTKLVATTSAGVIAPRLLNADGSVQESWFRFPTLRGWFWAAIGLDRLVGRRPNVGPPTDEEHGGWASGAALLVRREAWRQVGGFDPAYRFYVEEVDLQERLAARGWTRVIEPQAAVTHFGGSRPVSAQRFLLSHDGWERYFGTRSGRPSQVGARLVLAFLAFTRFVAWSWLARAKPERDADAPEWSKMFGLTALISLSRLPSTACRRHEPYVPTQTNESRLIDD